LGGPFASAEVQGPLFFVRSRRARRCAGFNFEQKLTPNTKVIDKFRVETRSRNASTMNHLSLR